MSENDIVERLRNNAVPGYPANMMTEAAAEITALRAENARLRKALRQIAEVGYVSLKIAPAMHDEAIKIARAALEAKP